MLNCVQQVSESGCVFEIITDSNVNASHSEGMVITYDLPSDNEYSFTAQISNHIGGIIATCITLCKWNMDPRSNILSIPIGWMVVKFVCTQQPMMSRVCQW